MKKQEAINKLKNELLTYNDESGWFGGYKSGIKQGISVIKDITETTSTVTVPKFVADWINHCKQNATLTECLEGKYERSNGVTVTPDDKLFDWIAKDENDELTAKAWLFGYEVQEVSRFQVSKGDLVIRKGPNEAKIHIVEAISDDSILLVNGVRDEFYATDDEGGPDNDLDYFYSNFRLFAKKENLEVEK